MRTALSIAGSDSSGGAGIQADIKTMSANGVYAMTAVTALTAQNTTGVTDILDSTPAFLSAQLDAVFTDIFPDAVKIGMVSSAELISVIAQKLRQYGARHIVVDPVMVATSGDPLLEREAIGTLRDELIPYSRVITPNLPEASLLLGETVDHQDQLEDAARELSRLTDSKVSVMLKAGHLTDNELTDIFYNAETGRSMRLTSPRVRTENTHGTGCTLSSAIAAYLAKGADLDTAARLGKEYLAGAIAAGAQYTIGHGHGPVHHFHPFY